MQENYLSSLKEMGGAWLNESLERNTKFSQPGSYQKTSKSAVEQNVVQLYGWAKVSINIQARVPLCFEKWVTSHLILILAELRRNNVNIYFFDNYNLRSTNKNKLKNEKCIVEQPRR